jgi:hypothetical protein
MFSENADHPAAVDSHTAFCPHYKIQVVGTGLKLLNLRHEITSQDHRSGLLYWFIIQSIGS